MDAFEYLWNMYFVVKVIAPAASVQTQLNYVFESWFSRQRFI